MELQKVSEADRGGIELVKSETGIVTKFPSLSLSAESPVSPSVKVTVEKLPLPMEVGKLYGHSDVLFDQETENMQRLASQAEALNSLPEDQRPRELLKLFRSNVHYAYNAVVSELTKTNPELAEWVSKNTGLDSSGGNQVKLSDIIDKGYGVCRHLSVGYLWLASKAGLEGTLMVSGSSGITNIQRTDNGEYLFKSADIGQEVGAHAWSELKLSNGRWIPVDPSVQLVGDTEEGLEMFRKARYEGVGNEGIDTEASPRNKLFVTTSTKKGVVFMPGEATAKAEYILELGSTRPTHKIEIRKNGVKSETIPPTNEPYSGPGELKVAVSPWEKILKLIVVDAQVA